VDADRQDDPLRRHRLAVLERQPEPAAGRCGDVDRLLLGDVRREAPLEGVAIAGEHLHRGEHGGGVVMTFAPAELFERQSALGLRQAGRPGVRFQQHPGRHPVFPGFHGFPENPEPQARALEVGGERESIRTGSDDCEVKQG
jgi:hypothetical protein